MRAKHTFLVVACGTTAAAIAYYYWWRRRPKRRWAHGVEVRQSRIPAAGDGLFAARRFEAGAVLGEYRGQVLSLLQAYKLEDRDYLMGGFGLNAHVDARFALDAPARYVNDNFDPTKLNARFEKNKEAKRALLLLRLGSGARNAPTATAESTMPAARCCSAATKTGGGCTHRASAASRIMEVQGSATRARAYMNASIGLLSSPETPSP